MEKLDELITRLAKDAPAVKPAPHPVLLGLEWMAVSVAYLIFALAISGLRNDLMSRLHDPMFVAEIAVLAGILITTSISAALLSFPDMHQMRRVAFAPAVMFGLFVPVMIVAWLADNPPSPPPVHNVECTLSITLLAILPAVWIFFVMRQFATTHEYWAGGIALLAAFSVGALWLRLYEHTDSIMHVIEWHYLPMIIIGLIGMWLGRKVLKW